MTWGTVTIYGREKPVMRIDEINEFHPLMECWLDEHGYGYIHEYIVPHVPDESGVRIPVATIDYLATHKEDGHKFIVECKPALLINKAIEQVQRYRFHTKIHKAAIAVLVDTLHDAHRKACKALEIEIIEIDKPYHLADTTKLHLELAYLYLYSLGYRYTLMHIQEAVQRGELKSGFEKYHYLPHHVFKDELLNWAIRHP